MAGRLIRKLIPLWSQGAALVHALGKHYPGEQLPRWALNAYWRRDGEPVWRDPLLLASDDDQGNAGYEQAATFCAALADRLGVDPRLINPAYEDIHYYLWKEHRLPANVLLEDTKLRDPLERARLARVYAQGLASPVGSVLPLRRAANQQGRAWQSGRWFLRGDALFLVPGDSPIGLRLPLESLPWADPAHIEIPFTPDPFANLQPLPRRTAHQPARQTPYTGPNGAAPPAFSELGPIPQDRPIPGHEDPDLVRTALAVEARNGKLHIFYPPLYAAEDWLELTAAIEATASDFGCQVVLEGYLPPRDPRLQQFSVTPDPGVIEVNIHPAETWPEMVERTEQLYAAARQTGLAAEKFALDGRHVGTGGGNHVVMGAALPADSPFLRRPDLIKSLLGFWHNHPSLSYLFSGLFIGPTSQHPRIDEARMDSLNELEIAFTQIHPHRSRTALAHRPPASQHPCRRHRQHPPHRILHRQDVRARKRHRPARPGGIPRARNAARRPHVRRRRCC